MGHVVLADRAGSDSCAQCHPCAAYRLYGLRMGGSRLLWCDDACKLFRRSGKYPIDYDVPRLLFYFVIAGVLYAVSLIVELPSEWSTLLFRTLLLCIYVFIVCRHEKISLKDIIKRKI